MTSAKETELGAPRDLDVSLTERGNRVLLYGEGEEARVLKLYRTRHSHTGELLSSGSHRLFERKRGATPAARSETEGLTLEMWSRHGFDVFRRLDLPLPPDISPPAIWLEYCPGRTLGTWLRDPEVDLDDKAAQVHRLAAGLVSRHRLALHLSEPLLLQEHATTKHVLLYGERMIWFDFEGGFLPGFPIMEGLAQELAGYLRSLWNHGGAAFPYLVGPFIDGYADRELLREIAQWGVHHTGLYRRVRRWYDRRQRGASAKTEALRNLLESLDSGTA